MAKLKYNPYPLYIANGNWFISQEDVQQYATKLGLRITNTETIKKGKKNYGHRIIVTLDK